MADNYDGSIRIDTAINTVPLDNGLEQIGSKIKSLAGTIGLAFGVKELINFGKRSVDAASDLAEAQNVVDTAFGEMSYKMEQFASTALDVYGISELTAKNMGSTYMAMAKGMGVATDAASDMAVTLTGRLSDIMSFYNKTQSEVDTIGRALITGETEPLKAIGVVMTQTNLSAYAMAQGFSKTYTEMSSNEQLLVRYKYFLEQTSLAQGDFAKTSEGWANQTRLLSERINEFMTNLGGLIINTFTPALQFANEAVSFLNELFFGDKNNVEDASAVKNAEAVTDEVTAMGTAAEKSEKKLNNLLSGFDELHIISGAKADENTEVKGAGIDTSNLLGVSLEADTETANRSAKKYREIINEIYLAFKTHPLAKAVEDIIEKLGEFFGFFTNGEIDAGKLTKSLMDILSAILACKAVTGIIQGVTSVDKALLSLSKTSTTFGAGFGNLIGLITAHPVAAAAVGLTALAVGIYTLDRQLEHQRIVDCFGDISISLDEIDELVSPITEDIDKVADAFADSKQRLNTARDDFNEVAQAVQKTADALKKGNTAHSAEDYAKQLEYFASSALEVNSATYDTTPFEKMFLLDDGVIDENEQKLLDQINGFGDEIADKIKKCNDKIQSIFKTAASEQRGLLESELKNIQELYTEIAKMTQTQEDIKTSATWERLKNGDYSYDSYAELAEQIKQAQEQAEKSRQAAEQAAYENVMVKANNMMVNGASEQEVEAWKKEMFAEIKEDMKALEIESKRYERDIIMNYAEGAFSNMTKEWRITPEGQKKLEDYFKVLINSPEGFDIGEVVSKLGMVEQDDLRSAQSIIDTINSELGLDLRKEWARLNEEIGDTKINIDDFYTALNNIVDGYEGFSVDDFLPDTEEFKKSLDETSKVIEDWTSAVDPQISVKVTPDMELFDRFTGGELKSTYSAADLLASTGAMLPGYSPLTEQKPTTLEVRIYNNDEKVIEGPVPIGKNSSFIADNGKSNRWRNY